MSDFMKIYLPIYVFYILFISFIAVSMQISSGAVSVTLPSSVEFTASWAKNSVSLILQIITFQVEGLPGILLTLMFFLPTIPIVIWVMEIIIAIIPF